jgi:hypothetical protein
MTVQEVKDELKDMEPPVLQEILSFILQLKRQQDPERKNRISSVLDSPNSKWLSLDEMDTRLAEE